MQREVLCHIGTDWLQVTIERDIYRRTWNIYLHILHQIFDTYLAQKLIIINQNQDRSSNNPIVKR